MPFGLIKLGLRGKRPPKRALPAPRPLKSRYDVVIIGGGGHGLATAYYLARDHGITDVHIQFGRDQFVALLDRQAVNRDLVLNNRFFASVLLLFPML